MDEEKDEKTEKAKEELTKLIFECMICHKVFPEPGMCQKCDVVLKAKAA